MYWRKRQYQKVSRRKCLNSLKSEDEENNIQEALLLDKTNGDNKWSEAIMKEMIDLDRLNVFQYYDPGTFPECTKIYRKA
eukprot:7331618-Ditylum_brightwellii.AAC.2